MKPITTPCPQAWRIFAKFLRAKFQEEAGITDPRDAETFVTVKFTYCPFCGVPLDASREDEPLPEHP